MSSTTLTACRYYAIMWGEGTGIERDLRLLNKLKSTTMPMAGCLLVWVSQIRWPDGPRPGPASRSRRSRWPSTEKPLVVDRPPGVICCASELSGARVRTRRWLTACHYGCHHHGASRTPDHHLHAALPHLVAPDLLQEPVTVPSLPDHGPSIVRSSQLGCKYCRQGLPVLLAGNMSEWVRGWAGVSDHEDEDG